MSEHALQEQFSSGKTRIEVSGEERDQQLLLEFRIEGENDCLLHWGLSERRSPVWHAPPEESWPPETRPFDQHAVQSPCGAKQGSDCRIRIALPSRCPWHSLPFVLYFPNQQRWLRNGRQDFRLQLLREQQSISPQKALEESTREGEWRYRSFDLGDGLTLASAIAEEANGTRVMLVSNAEPPLQLHWGVSKKSRQHWQLPAEAWRPEGSSAFDDKAVRSPFTERQDGLNWLELEFPLEQDSAQPLAINCLLYQPWAERWLKQQGRDLHIGLTQELSTEGALASQQARELADRIVDAEMHSSSWTLMHRFNLCHDLLTPSVETDREAMTLLYVWLRFSAIRQLDWQRRYNTKPRELSHSQERLTLRLAEVHQRAPQGRFWVRLMLGTLGPGGEGQKVRDEILNIMHRHHIKEMHGHFMEEWHQKLHNNTTPDDIVICQAYLAFLHSGGDLEKFYTTLEEGGVDRKRLQSFERPIRTDPEFYPDKRDGLIYDFEQFLGILNSVHSGTDLDTAVGAARGVLDTGLNDRIDGLYGLLQSDSRLADLIEAITSLREGLSEYDDRELDAGARRALVYLDLSLEQLLRNSIERQSLSGITPPELMQLVWLVLRNLRLNDTLEELQLCARQLERLRDQRDESADWALHAKSITDRSARVVAQWSESIYDILQPHAEGLGKALEVEEWTIPLFSEEVIRGGAAFMLSLLLRCLDPWLRTQAGLGGWQVISRADTSGQVRVVDSLRAVQGENFSTPTVLVTDRVAGDEEIPSGVTSVITSDTPDLVSHVAVRARNAHVLFATCYDHGNYDTLKQLQGKRLALAVNPAGDLDYREQLEAAAAQKPTSPGHIPKLRRRGFSSWAVAADAFNDEVVGGKSNNLQGLRGRLSDWIRIPSSMALPFGVFEKTLDTPENQAVKEQLEQLLSQATEKPDQYLPRARKLLSKLQAPTPLREALQETWKHTGLPEQRWESIWATVTRVWASKWNERAWFSRIAHQIPHQDLMMAVLIQQVVEADYAFVIHTVNPTNNREDELFVELVLGLGETLVGNFPGRALGVSYRKSDLQPTLHSYPSKSLGLYGSGVIFRSDSNGEDLEGFAGAGLYDSFLSEPARERILDYSGEPMVWDPRQRESILQKVAQIGIEVEQHCGSAQDIEGAVQGDDYYLIQTRPQVGND